MARLILVTKISTSALFIKHKSSLIRAYRHIIIHFHLLSYIFSSLSYHRFHSSKFERLIAILELVGTNAGDSPVNTSTIGPGTFRVLSPPSRQGPRTLLIASVEQEKEVGETDLASDVHDTVDDDFNVDADEIDAFSEDPDDALTDANAMDG